MTKKITVFLIILFFLSSCQAFKPKKVDTRETPVSGLERARKNVEEGGSTNIGNLLKRGGGSFEFSSSNPMWRASLEILDFLPMTTVDYSGGMIISDWYTGDNNNNESIKITVRFLSNEVRSDSLKVIVHKKKCSSGMNCKISLLNNSKISQELLGSILSKAALFENQDKKKKRK
ncbi:DUF3576 domain-containing protein [Pelagibacteraceae bacterium]|nr:DUF3576 domain-containing protein [Pelagibacteraceae bacterium]